VLSFQGGGQTDEVVRFFTGKVAVMRCYFMFITKVRTNQLEEKLSFQICDSHLYFPASLVDARPSVIVACSVGVLPACSNSHNGVLVLQIELGRYLQCI